MRLPRRLRRRPHLPQRLHKPPLRLRSSLEQRELPDVNEVVRETLALPRSEADRYSLSIRADLA